MRPRSWSDWRWRSIAAPPRSNSIAPSAFTRLRPRNSSPCATRRRRRAMSPPSRSGPRADGLGVELRIVAEDAVLVEGNAPARGEIGFDARPRGDAVVQIAQARQVFFECLHGAREGVAQARDGLEQR